MTVLSMEPRRRPARKRSRAAHWAPYYFVAAAALYLMFFTAIPMLRGLWFSVTDSNLLNPDGGAFIGVENYQRLLSDDKFYSSLATTLLYTAGTVVGSLLLGSIAAVAINDRIRGRAFFRAVLTIPWAVPSVASRSKSLSLLAVDSISAR